MNNSIQMELSVATSNKGFSLDEFVCTLRELMTSQGMAGIAALVLELIDEHMCVSICRKAGIYPSPQCCQEPDYEIANLRYRKFRTSLGDINIQWRYLRCKRCGKTNVPLRDFLGLKPYQSKTNELERIVVEVAGEQSYRRGSAHLQTIGQIPVPKSTAHRWVAQSDCDKIDPGHETFDILYADGTGYKRRPDPAKDVNNKGEVRLAFGIDNRGRTRPLGAWSGESWERIAADIKGERQDCKPVANLMLSDGETGMISALDALCDFRQRCHWHGGRDLNYTMWTDKAPLDERKNIQSELAGIIAVELPQEDIEKICDEDRLALMDQLDEAERKVDQLHRRLLAKNYVKAGDYVGRLKRQLFSYVRCWLETGLVSPRAASWIERVMREVGRRLKRMAFGWSETGAAKMTRIILKRFTDKKGWDNYWKQKLKIQDNVMWMITRIQESPTNLGR